ncbi:MAG: serine/threonine-protein kinase [Myxococcota bacterium]
MSTNHTEEQHLEGLPEVGDLVGGKYEVDGIIGIGGMGAVLAGTHVHLRQPVAIKVLLPTFLEHQDVRERFLREARSAARLRSDHVTRIYDVGALETGLPYMVMERLEGINLADALRQDGPFDADRAVGYVLQACEAVAEAHAAGIVHRDLKPDNLFLASKPNGSVVIKVLDFGISKSAEEIDGVSVPALTGPHSLLGSPHYMSPEQVRDSSEVDARTDVWALGVLLYELITQHMPFQASSLPDLYVRILSSDPTPPQQHGAQLPNGLVATIMACLDKRLTHRIADVGILADRLAVYGPDWAQASVEHVRHALQSRSSTPSLRPALAPVSSAPTPTHVGSQVTIAARRMVSPPPRSRLRSWQLGLGGVVATALAASAIIAAAPAGSLWPGAERIRAGAMLAGLSTAYRSTAASLEMRLSPPVDQAAAPAPDTTSGAEKDGAETAAVRPSVRKAAKPASKSSKSSGEPRVRDLKSITLID